MRCSDRTPFPATFFDRPAPEVAPDLIGAWLRIGATAGLITETEAYGADDPASHSFRGPTARNAAMFGPPGHAYVYRSYGVHWCLNVVCRRGEAVLFRALDPQLGLDLMAARRGADRPALLARGPGRLGQALGVTRALDGLRFDQPDLCLSPGETPAVLTGTRIGITRAADLPWRFGWAGSPHLSRRFPAATASTPG